MRVRWQAPGCIHVIYTAIKYFFGNPPPPQNKPMFIFFKIGLIRLKVLRVNETFITKRKMVIYSRWLKDNMYMFNQKKYFLATPPPLFSLDEGY